MGALADAALAAGGKLIGILPKFMNDLEWGHKSLTELRLVDDMHHRKRMMIEESDAVVALPGGSGTFEELLEAITWKRLGLFVNPIVIVNVRGFYDSLRELLERAITERFMDERHRQMWTFVNHPEDVLAAIRAAPEWSAEARAFARPESVNGTSQPRGPAPGRAKARASADQSGAARMAGNTSSGPSTNVHMSRCRTSMNRSAMARSSSSRSGS